MNFIFLFFLNLIFSYASNDPVMDAMRDEIKRSISRLKDENFPLPYFISYSVYDVERCSMEASFGRISSHHSAKKRTAKSDLRIGSSEFDNSNFATNLNAYFPIYMEIPFE